MLTQEGIEQLLALFLLLAFFAAQHSLYLALCLGGGDKVHPLRCHLLAL